MKTEIEKIVKSVNCTACGAPAGSPCQTKDGNNVLHTYVHVAREKKYKYDRKQEEKKQERMEAVVCFEDGSYYAYSSLDKLITDVNEGVLVKEDKVRAIYEIKSEYEIKTMTFLDEVTYEDE